MPGIWNLSLGQEKVLKLNQISRQPIGGHTYTTLCHVLFSLSYTHIDSSVMYSLSYTLTPAMYTLFLLHTQVLYTWSLNLDHSAVKEPFLRLHLANRRNSFYCDPTCLSRTESKNKTKKHTSELRAKTKTKKHNTFTALTLYGAD